MIYLDNAATSFFKPLSVINAIDYDLRHAANSGRSAHKSAVEAGLKIEACRNYLLSALGAAEGYRLVFTKNCTEALNLGIFGLLKVGSRVVTSANEHNSVLRPLFELKRRGIIDLFVVGQSPDGSISSEHVKRALQNADFCVFSGVSNVTGARIDISDIGNAAAKYGVVFLLDGAQTVPLTDVDMKNQRVDMLACPGHKGLHGMQGTGFLIYREDLSLTPLLFGGTGTSSLNVYQPTESPEAYEAGTQFAGGIAALKEGAQWSFANAQRNRKSVSELGKETVYRLRTLGATLYTKDYSSGVISFNLFDNDSATVAEMLDEADVAVRSGLHCAPLTHRFLKTEKQGAVRASLGVDTTIKDIDCFSAALEKLIRGLKI